MKIPPRNEELVAPLLHMQCRIYL